jgi:hypothetical protein
MEKQLIALILTLILEGFAVLLMMFILRRFQNLHPINPRLIEKLCLCCLAASLCTHPFAWYFNQLLKLTLSTQIRFAVIEGFVVLVESYFYWKLMGFKGSIAFIFAFGANAFSFLIGLKIYPIVIQLIT